MNYSSGPWKTINNGSLTFKYHFMLLQQIVSALSTFVYL